MMKYLTALFFTFFSLITFADLSNIEINNKRAPLLIKTILSELSIESKSSLTLLNKYLAGYPDTSTKSLFLSEFYKSFYKPWKIRDLRSFQGNLSVKDLEGAKKKLQDNILITSKFTEFFLVEIFLAYEEKIKASDDKSTDSLNKFLAPWVQAYLKIGPDEFQKILTKTAKIYFQDLVKIAHIISFQAPIKSSESSIATFSNLESIKENSSVIGTKGPSTKGESTPEEIVAPLNVDTQEAVSEEIDKLIENINN